MDEQDLVEANQRQLLKELRAAHADLERVDERVLLDGALGELSRNEELASAWTGRRTNADGWTKAVSGIGEKILDRMYPDASSRPAARAAAQREADQAAMKMNDRDFAQYVYEQTRVRI